MALDHRSEGASEGKYLEGSDLDVIDVFHTSVSGMILKFVEKSKV